MFNHGIASWNFGGGDRDDEEREGHASTKYQIAETS